MGRSFRSLLLRDKEFWFGLLGFLTLLADAVAEASISPLRVIAILVIVVLLDLRVLELRRLHLEKQIPFLVVIGKSDEEYRDTLGQVRLALDGRKINVEVLEKGFGLYGEDWVYRRESPLPEAADSWRETLLRVESKFWRLAERVPGKKVYHLFINGPSAFAMGMGALLGARTVFVLYHYEGNAYHPLIDFSRAPVGVHTLKTHVEAYEYLQVDKDELKPGETGEVNVALYLAGHDPRGGVKQLSQEQKRPMVSIVGRFQGTIPHDADWIKLSREVASILLELSSDPRVTRLHLFLSLPLVIAFATGSALGRFVKASLYNWFPRAGYREVLRLDDFGMG